LLNGLSDKPLRQIASSLGFAVASSFFFFAVTNFGVWLQGWYPMNVNGLVDCFLAAIPFYRTMLIGNLIIIPAVVAVYQYVKFRIENKLEIDTVVG
jgi:hypothetical protein